jgi:hypothetical protein
MKRRRCGYSLIECLTVFALISVTMGTVAAVLHILNRTNAMVRDETMNERNLERIVTQLRQDAHEAESATVIPSDSDDPLLTQLQLDLPDGRSIRYVLLEERVERTVTRGDETDHRETYRIPQMTSAEWTLDEDRAVPLVSLVMDLRATGGTQVTATTSPLQIDAAINLLHARVSQPETVETSITREEPDGHE